VHLFGFIRRIYQDARSPEHQISPNIFLMFSFQNKMKIVVYFVSSKTIITINAWKPESPSVRVFAAEMLANTFGPKRETE